MQGFGCSSGSCALSKRSKSICRAKAMPDVDRQLGKIAVLSLGMAHRKRNGFMRVSKRQSFAHQIVGKVGGGRKAFARRSTHSLSVDLDAASDQLGHDSERGQDGVDDVEYRLLVFLIVLVVGQGLAFHYRQQCDEVPE